MIGVSTRLKTLAATGVLAGGLGLAAFNGVFAASSPASAAAAASPTAVAASTTPTSKPTGPVGGPRGPRGHFGPGQDFLAPLATYLGMNASDLQTALHNGQTLAQVAQAHGKTASDVKTFLTNQLKTNLDKAVAAGKMTSAQETNILNNASSRFDSMINNTFPAKGPGRGFGPGFRGGFGPMGTYVSTTAKTLGMTDAQVQSELQSGKTLAQIAQEHGKTASDLETAIINTLKPQIEQMLNNKFQGRPWGRPGAPKASPTPAAPAPTATP